MTLKATILPRLWVLAAISCASTPAAVLAQSGSLSLDQAVEQVQKQTGGTVLSAEPRHFGRRMEYRIKVLSPDGHVQVVAVPADKGRSSTLTETKPTPAGRGRGNKEKH